VKQRLIHSGRELDILEAIITRAAASTATRLAEHLQQANALAALAQVKFSPTGCDPLELDRPLNFVEQLNQSFTYLASIEAARWLLERHPDHVPLQLNLGTSPGSDIASLDGAIAAEVFAATHPDSNDKLRKDIQKVRTTAASHRYVFYLSPVPARVAAEDVTVVRLNHACLGHHRDVDA